MKKILVLLLGLTLLAACGPQYSTQYSYTAPRTDSGKQCANECLTNKINCDMACTLQQQQCYQRARIQDDMDDFLYRTSYWRGGMGHSAGMGFGVGRSYGMSSNRAYSFCRGEVCLGSCLQTHHQCFTQCGGQITEVVVCTQNCPTETTAAPQVR